ncbi:MAG: hypothetical protein ACRDDZ_01360 [Marinifilaceae bacterium]
MKYTHTKSVATIYKIRPTDNHGGWADISLDDQGDGRGRLTISSDYGSWAYYWGSMGGGFKKFLITCDECYLFRCLSNKYIFDEHATKKALYQDIKEARKNRDITADEAKEICDDLSRAYIANYRASADDILSCTEKIYYNDPTCIPYQHISDPAFDAFFDGPWKAFIEIIKSEIEQP